MAEPTLGSRPQLKETRMSVLGIANAVISQFEALASRGNSHQLHHGFQQLAQDLQSRNLSQAQSDFASLQQLLPGNPQNLAVPSISGTQKTDPLASAVSQLAKDLQSRNLAAAKQAYSTLQQDFQQFALAASAATSGSTSPNLSLSA
jgi:hypothetical protein